MSNLHYYAPAHDNKLHQQQSQNPQPLRQCLLIRRADGKHELVGGSAGDFSETKEWVSLFAHEIVFKRPVKQQQQRGFSFGARLG
jgi:hypothetical protein